jgi:hypothetical protein
MTRVPFHGWECLRVDSPTMEILAPVEIGPRVVRLGRPGGPNLLHEIPEDQGGRGEPEFRARGGHRLWHAPEHGVRTYQPDNVPVEVEAIEGGVRLSGQTESATGLRKSIAFQVVGPRHIRVTHVLASRALFPVTCAPWALTMLRRGGLGVFPLLPKKPHSAESLLPTTSLVTWSYTDFSLPTWRFSPRFVTLDTLRADGPQKVGFTHHPGWAAFWFEGDVFVKAAPRRHAGPYPDRDASLETFVNDAFIELESLGPLAPLGEGDVATHEETWGLLTGIERPENEAAYVGSLLPAVEEWLAEGAALGSTASSV